MPEPSIPRRTRRNAVVFTMNPDDVLYPGMSIHPSAIGKGYLKNKQSQKRTEVFFVRTPNSNNND